MRILIDMDPQDVRRIQDKATALGVTPGAVLRSELAQKQRAVHVRERIRALWEQGLCDADVAAELNMTNQWVAYLRRGMGLPANRRYPRRQTASAENGTAA